MADDRMEYGKGEMIDQQILDDYDSEAFDVGGIADDYEPGRTAGRGGKRAGIGKRAVVFGDTEEPSTDWGFEGMQIQKHSRKARRTREEQEQQAAFEQVSKTIKAPIASATVGDVYPEASGEEGSKPNDFEE